MLLELGKSLLKINAFKVGTFPTREGKISPYFIDLRRIASYPEAFDLSIQCMHDLISASRDSFEAFCAIPFTGLVLSAPLALSLHKSLIFPVKDGTQTKIQGFIRPGLRVLMLEDISETGYSFKGAIDAVRSSGGVVEEAVSLIDRREGAERRLSEIGVKFRSFTNTHELASRFQDMMALSQEQEQAIRSSPEKI